MEDDGQAGPLPAGGSNDDAKAQPTEDDPTATPPASGAGPRDSRLVSDPDDPWAGTRMTVALAGSVVLLLGMRAAADVVAPIVLSLVIAVAISPAIGWLVRKGLKTSTAFAITVTVTVVAEIALIIIERRLAGNHSERFLRQSSRHLPSATLLQPNSMLLHGAGRHSPGLRGTGGRVRTAR